MLRGDVGNFVRNHRRQFVIVFSDPVESAEDTHFPSCHREGVDLLRDFEHDKLPVGIGHVPENDLGDAIANPLKLGDALLVARERVLALHIVERRDAHLRDFFVIDEIHRLATGDGYLIATAEHGHEEQERCAEKSCKTFHGD